MVDILEYANTVALMRQCQKEYKKKFTNAAATELAKYESKVDKMTKEIRTNKKENLENDLFSN